MYQTLTRGLGLMPPQAWMVPQQKYDVTHYIREEFLKESNKSEYAAITEGYLAGLPKGDTRGPAPRVIEPWVTMDYGPSLINTYEIGSGNPHPRPLPEGEGARSNIAQKGIAVRLDAGAGGVSRGRAWMIFEHDTLRWAAGWTGSEFIDWNGIHFNGKHQVHPRVVGDVSFRNPAGPGWADPASGLLSDDQRVTGRDGRRYGPLPRAWGRFRGLYHHGDRIVVPDCRFVQRGIDGGAGKPGGCVFRGFCAADLHTDDAGGAARQGADSGRREGRRDGMRYRAGRRRLFVDDD
jgi:hypothetical protein